MSKVAVQPGIMDISLYVGGKSSIAGHDTVLKLSSNENPLGPPPSALTAIAEAAGNAHLYPATDHLALREAISAAHGVEVDRLVCGVGSDEVLQFICQAFSGPGDEIIYTEHGFSMYPILARMAGATPVKVLENNRVVDVDAILAAVNDKTRIVMLTNPGNPTGTVISDAEITRLADGLPEHVVLVLDAAYLEFAGEIDGGLSLAHSRPNVIMTRTFSKIYGLGGLRIGWGYGPKDLIDVLLRVRQPFNLSVVQLAAAEAAAKDHNWLKDCADLNAVQRARLVQATRDLGLGCDDSSANFVLVRFKDQAEAEAADAMFQSHGIIVRRVAGYGFPEALRITVGDEEQTGRVIDALSSWRKGA